MDETVYKAPPKDQYETIQSTAHLWSSPVRSVREFFAHAKDLFVRAADESKKRIKVLRTGPQGDNNTWSLNFGVALAHNDSSFATWRYELYLSLWTRVLRIGFVSMTQEVVAKGEVMKFSFENNNDGTVTIVPEGKAEVVDVQDYAPDEANERF